MRNTFNILRSRTLWPCVLVLIMASGAAAQGITYTPPDRSADESPRRFAPPIDTEPVRSAALPPQGETLPRAQFDDNQYRHPRYEQHDLPPVEAAQFEQAPLNDSSPSAGDGQTLEVNSRGEAATASFEAPPIPLSKPKNAKPLPRPGNKNNKATEEPPSGVPGLTTVLGSLVVVLFAFFAVAWVMRRGMPNRLAALPNEVIEVLGRSTLATRNQMHLIRIGNKLLLVSVTPTGAETLTEITDPAEVERLGSACSQAQSNGIAQSFRGVLDQMNREAEPSKVDSLDELSEPRRRSSLLGKLTGKERHDA